ncbi:MAG: ABC transporter substrate-binding protein [Pseudomonadota bacterium]
MQTSPGQPHPLRGRDASPDRDTLPARPGPESPPNGGWMAALFFNLRRPPLDDVRVRQALTLAYHGPWTRNTLFGGSYAPPGNPYGASDLAAKGRADPAEQALLEPFLSNLPDGILEAPSPPDTDSLDRRARLRRADALLEQAGYVVVDGVRVRQTTGEPLRLEFIGTRPAFGRVLSTYAKDLDRLGIALDIRFFDYAQGRDLILGHQFDLTTAGFGAEFPPGRDERVYWHSERALKPGYALAGAQDPALDATIEAMTESGNYGSILAATRAFERVLSWQRYMLPLWRTEDVWIAHNRDLAFPDGFVFPGFHYIPYLYWKQ